ncbi:MAG: hypothetical protein M5U19_15425 [Microthrixaceae bacterium]|nr:hypothetical protein [Microthrixaceae bacterium]
MVLWMRGAGMRAWSATTVLFVAALFVGVLAVACVPKELHDPTEVGGAQDVVAEPPVFPKTGQVPPELLVEGLVYDFSSNDVDLDLWVPRPEEARCAAESIVDAFAVQLSDLGYAPGVSGAGSTTSPSPPINALRWRSCSSPAWTRLR